MTPRTRGFLFFGLTLLLACVFLRLSWWQFSRLGERRSANAAHLAARGAAPLGLDSIGEAESVDNRRVELTGQYDLAADVVLRGQSEQGVPGVRIVTPLRLAGRDDAVLVQRGFVTSGDARAVDLSALREEGLQRVEGIAFIVPPQAGEPAEVDGQVTWRRVDFSALGARLPYRLLPFVVLQLPDSALPRLPRRDDPPPLDDGPHLSYAVQWLAFALTALVVGGLVAFRKPVTPG
jgi:surfeit locus 1 family protein